MLDRNLRWCFASGAQLSPPSFLTLTVLNRYRGGYFSDTNARGINIMELCVVRDVYASIKILYGSITMISVNGTASLYERYIEAYHV